MENTILFWFVKKVNILNKDFYIKSYCKIEFGKVTLNGTVIFEDHLNNRNEFFKNLYKSFEIKYSKFFKMDNLCKLAFLAAELLVKDGNIDSDRRKAGIILSNNATLAGHSKLANNVIIGGLTALHQFTRVGEYAMIGGCSAVNKDIPPYFMASGNYVQAQGINSVGLKRHGFSSATIMEIKRAYKSLCRNGNTLAEAKAEIAENVKDCPELKILLDFISDENRGIVR